MTKNETQEVETIVNALLQVGDRVVEVSKDHVMTRIWDSYLSTLGTSYQYLGKKITDLSTENIVTQCDELVTKSFALRENSIVQYHVPDGDSSASYSIRILAIHPHQDFLFVVIKKNSVKEGIEITEDKWRLALDAAGDGMWDLNMQTGEISFSAKWHDIFGYNPSEISKWDDWSSKIHPDDKEGYKKNVEDYLAGKTPCYSIEQRYLCKDGNYKWVLSRGVVISKTGDGKPLRAIGTHHDINDRKLAEEALRTSRETFSNVFNYSGIGIALIKPDGAWLDVNGPICQMTGYSKDELMKLTHHDVTYPADQEIDSGLIEQMLSRNIDTYTIEKRYLSKQKKVIFGLLTVSLVWNNRLPSFFICQVVDITRKKEMENEIKKKNAKLEAAKVSLTSRIARFEELNNLIMDKLKEPADNINALSGALIAAGKKSTSDPINVSDKTLTTFEALEMLYENSTSLINSIASLRENMEHSKG